ncbi:MAG: hypothetical protein Q9159_001229 [Coniocarpon cinnabarinum]
MSPYARVMRSFRPLLSTVPRRRLQLCAARFAGKEDALRRKREEEVEEEAEEMYMIGEELGMIGEELHMIGKELYMSGRSYHENRPEEAEAHKQQQLREQEEGRGQWKRELASNSEEAGLVAEESCVHERLLRTSPSVKLHLRCTIFHAVHCTRHNFSAPPPPPPLSSTPPSYTDLSILPSTTGSTPRTTISHTQPRPQPLSPHSPD